MTHDTATTSDKELEIGCKSFHCLALTFRRPFAGLSLTIHCLSLTFRCFSVTNHCPFVDQPLPFVDLPPPAGKTALKR